MKIYSWYLVFSACRSAAPRCFCPLRMRAQDDKVIKEISYADTERILGTLKIDYENVSEGTYRFQLAG
jgi:hypothetical protein